MKYHYAIAMTAALVVVAILFCASVAYGSTVIPMSHVIAAIAKALGWSSNTAATPIDRIIVDLRLPRAMLAIAVGAGLGVVGLLLQTVTRNDLADPFLFGLSAGAAAGTVAVISRVGDRLGVLTLPIAAFAGGMCATTVVLLLIRRAQGYGPERLVLAGLAVSFLFAALTNYLVLSGDQRPRIPFCSGPSEGWVLQRGTTLALAFSEPFSTAILTEESRISSSAKAVMATRPGKTSIKTSPYRSKIVWQSQLQRTSA